MTAFRDGIFSASASMAPYGTLKTSYSDGALGASASLPPEVASLLVPGCQRRCDDVGRAYRWPKIKIKKCKVRCVGSPQRWSQAMSQQYQEAVASGLIAQPSKLQRPLVEGRATAAGRKTAPPMAGETMGPWAQLGSAIVGLLVMGFTFYGGSDRR